jgi:hypothetical protein
MEILLKSGTVGILSLHPLGDKYRVKGADAIGQFKRGMFFGNNFQIFEQ